MQAVYSRSRPAPADEALVAAIRNAEERAFGLLYERYFQRVYTFSFLRLRNHADTEEAVQETFTSVFRSIDAYRGESSLVSWIYGIARNTVNNQLRRTNAQHQRMAHAQKRAVAHQPCDVARHSRRRAESPALGRSGQRMPRVSERLAG